MSRTRSRDAEVRGHALDGIVTAVAALAPATRMRVQRILGDRDLLHVTTDDWYAIDDVLDAFDAIGDAVGVSVLRRLGMQLSVFTWEAVDADDPGVAIDRLDTAYGSAHRGQDVGGFAFEAYDGTTGRVVSTTPYPDAFDRGLLDATFTSDAETGLYARVSLLEDPATTTEQGGTDSETQSTARDPRSVSDDDLGRPSLVGSDTTTYEVTW